MKDQYKLLHELATIKAGSINTFFSYDAKTYKGALLWVNKRFNNYLKLGFIRAIPFNVRPAYARRQTLYQLTKKGLKTIGRNEDYFNKDHQSYQDINHELGKYDIALSFLRNFPDYRITVQYEKTFKASSDKKLKCDIFLKADKYDGTKSYTFIIEMENKDDKLQTYNQKIIPYQKAFDNNFLELNKLPSKTKVLIFFNHSHIPTYWRPVEYQDKDKIDAIKLGYKQFNDLIGHLANLDDKHFRLIPFQEFTKIAEPIWRMPSGVKVRIIE